MNLHVQGLIKEYGIVEQHESDDEEKGAAGEQAGQPPSGQSAPTTAEEREAAVAAAAHLAAATPEVRPAGYRSLYEFMGICCRDCRQLMKRAQPTLARAAPC